MSGFFSFLNTQYNIVFIKERDKRTNYKEQNKKQTESILYMST